LGIFRRPIQSKRKSRLKSLNSCNNFSLAKIKLLGEIGSKLAALRG
jgi:hypothetical protein